MAEMDMNEILEKARRAQAALSSELDIRHAYAEGLSGNAPAQEAGKNQLHDLSGAYARKWIADRQKSIDDKIAYYEGRKKLNDLESKNLKDLQKEKAELEAFSSTIGRKNSLTLDDQVAFVDVQITAEENKQKIASLQMQKIIPQAHTEADVKQLPEQKQEKYRTFDAEYAEAQHEIDALKRRKRSLVGKRTYQHRKEQQEQRVVTPAQPSHTKTTPPAKQELQKPNTNKNKTPQKEETDLTTTNTPQTKEDKKTGTPNPGTTAEHDETKKGPRKERDIKKENDKYKLSLEQLKHLQDLLEKEMKDPNSQYSTILRLNEAQREKIRTKKGIELPDDSYEVTKKDGSTKYLSSKELYDRLNPEKTAETGVAVPKKNSNHAYATDPDEKPAAITGQVAPQPTPVTEEKNKPIKTVVDGSATKTAPVQPEEKKEPVKQEAAAPEKKEEKKEKKESKFLSNLNNTIWPLLMASAVLSCLPGLAFLAPISSALLFAGSITVFLELVVPEIKDLISDIKDFVAHVKENKKIKENQKILQKAKDKDKAALNKLNARKKQLNKTLGTETVTKKGKKVKRPTHAIKTPLRKEAFAKYDDLKRHVKELKDIDSKYGFDEEKVAEWEQARKGIDPNDKTKLEEIDELFRITEEQAKKWEKERNPLLSRIEANSLSDAMRLEALAKTQYAEAKQAEADAIQEAQAELKTVEERIETQQEVYKKSKATFDKFVANPTSEPFEEFQLKDEPAPQPQPQATQVKFDDASRQAGQSKNIAREM